MNELPPAYKSGFVSIVGKPNAGKSTLTNRLLGQPVAGVSAKPQTTRKRQLAILTTDEAQIIFVDTPGLHEPKDKLSQFINSEAQYALHDADVILFLADASQKPDKMDETLASLVMELQKDIPVLLALNKIDLTDSKTLAANKALFQNLLPEARVVSISAQTGSGIENLLQAVRELLPEGPQYYPPDQITESFERDIAAEMVRAACMDLLEDEVPYSIAVRTDEYSERENGMLYVKATIFVEREAQKAIVIGKNGDMIKRIGSAARVEIEAVSGQKVFLDLTVKLRKDWKNDAAFLKELGLSQKS
ncbi:MAG TPA: GTPase Era [Anaerolineaceae bacterium]|jgi:GTP-binding protein Era|nr:GTPase Era [Anaerolineaceae bacterium]HOE35379.1 GTPase Era [Anaerolineaceae bacterium]HOT26069.1 GTPase Era [Anaerolineaceae bacterium]HQK03911.1 GTPase Era [Anaerolineaceae bacterium]HQL28230.1 GTPase Era [Anaerolineaceae bacterium]